MKKIIKKDIFELNEKYQTIDSLFNSNGKVNSKVIEKDWFYDLLIYKEILKMSKDLDVFEDVQIKDRINYIHDKMKLQFCKKCNMPFISFKTSQHTYRLCKHKELTDKMMHQLKNKTKNILNRLMVSLENEIPILNENEFSNKLNELSQKKPNYSFIMSNKYFDFYHDLILQTKNLIEINKDDLKLPERLYIILNKINEIPRCKFCNNAAYFINRVKGYSASCKECSIHKMDETLSLKYIETINQKVNNDRYQIIKYPRLLNRDPLIIKCRKCNGISEHMLHNGRLSLLNNEMLLCNKCEKIKSKPETEVYDFIASIIDNEKILHVHGSRKIIYPLELDICIPEMNLAFEFDGLYWHSEQSGKGRDYHLNKTKQCNKLDMQLIHIFEDEWEYKQDIVKSRIKNLLGIYDNTVFARKCKIIEVNSAISKDFQNKNHIQGNVNSKVNLGLYYNGELISLMTFGKCRFDKCHEWELLRFCNKLGYHVPGAAGKLLKYFERNYNPKSLVSYADRRWSQGNVYEKLGFQLHHISKPDYWYFKDKTRFSRLNYQKHKLKDILENFDPNKTEVQNMIDNGYYRIFDCGNLVFEKTY